MGLILDRVSDIMIVCRFIYLSTILVILYILCKVSRPYFGGDKICIVGRMRNV